MKSKKTFLMFSLLILASMTLAATTQGTPVASQSTQIAEALDNSQLAFTTGGDASWFLVEWDYHNDRDSAQSGAINHGEQTWIEVELINSGTLNFWWKASSQDNHDILSLYIDGVLDRQISGTQDWIEVDISISGPGVHVARWVYAKDASLTAGSDCGNVDQVTWTTTPGDPSFQRGVSVSGYTGIAQCNAYMQSSLSTGSGQAVNFQYREWEVNLELTTQGAVTLSMGFWQNAPVSSDPGFQNNRPALYLYLSADPESNLVFPISLTVSLPPDLTSNLGTASISSLLGIKTLDPESNQWTEENFQITVNQQEGTATITVTHLSVFACGIASDTPPADGALDVPGYPIGMLLLGLAAMVLLVKRRNLK